MQSPNHPLFASEEVAIFWRYIRSSLDRLMGVLDGQPPEVLSWRPPAPSTNSIFVLAHHTLANVRVNLLGTMCDQEFARDRDSEFTAMAVEHAAAGVPWPELRVEIEEALSRLAKDALDAEYVHHWRGNITGRELLIIVARHATEHLGQAELTRDLAVAALSADTAPVP